MDTKSLAKSKRAHSQHHSRKNNVHSAAKGSTAAGGSKNPTGKQIKVKAQPSHGSKTLPSNWDRYGQESSLGSEDTPHESTSQPTEFVVPKSKGSDYAYLISEATAHSRPNYSSHGFLSFDDGFQDFTQDFGPLLSAKGQSILSWITDDNFEFEDQTNTSHEAAFLSLNLNELAEHLARAKPSERLFLEPDLLPLLDEQLQSLDEQCNQVETFTSVAAVDSGASSLSQHRKAYKNAPEDHEPVLHSTTATKEVPVIPSREKLKKPMEQSMDEILNLQETVSISPSSSAPYNRDSASRSTFEAANAEADLDMLLNSFNDTKFLESPSVSSSRIPAAPETESVRKGAQAVVPANIGDTKSKLLDDFDSWLDSI